MYPRHGPHVSYKLEPTSLMDCVTVDSVDVEPNLLELYNVGPIKY